MTNSPSQEAVPQPSSVHDTPMIHNESDRVTFQITVARLAVSSPLPKEDIHVTVRIGDVSKITCSGELSEDSLTVTWNHPFLFTASPSTTVVVAICTLPKELTPDWDKQPLGDQVITNVANLLESSNEWKCNVLRLYNGLATVSMTCRAHAVLIVPDGHNCPDTLWTYASRLHDSSSQFQNVAIGSTSIEMWQAIVELCPISHADHTSALGNLGGAFMNLYDILGNIFDLNRAIGISQKRLDLCLSGHPQHVKALEWHVDLLWRLYQNQRNIADLERAIEMAQTKLDLCPFGHPGHASALGSLALCLEHRFHIQGNMTDLNRAIEMTQKWLDLSPVGHQDHHRALGNLGVSLHARYSEQGNLADLDKAIELKEKQLIFRPPGHPLHSHALQNLAWSLRAHYQATKTHSDLIRTTNLFKEALVGYPVQHHYFAFIIKGLAETILLPLEYSTQPFLSSGEAFQTYKLLKGCGPAVSLDTWDATLSWINNAEEYNHSSVLEAYQTSLNTLDYLTSMQSSVDSRHTVMQARARPADLANDAFSCAVRHDNLRMAVELLEQGRGILWNQLARFDTPLATLEGQGSHGWELANKFMELSTKLKNHAQGSGRPGVDPYWQVRKDWESVADEIRCQDGFSRFLLPPHFDDLQRAAERGPVIIANASQYTCDALIILFDRPPVHVPLRCSRGDVDDICSQFSILVRDQHAYGKNRESWVKQSLRELWSSVVEPIATVLQDDIQLPLGSRIWWYPTSKFTILPFHAAGPHRKDQKNLMDIYVSSYAPSLSALIRARERACSLKARDTSETANVISFAAVGQGKPCPDLKLLNLPEVQLEIEMIRNEAGVAPDVSFETVTGDAATIEGAVQAFRDHRWVHLACHGAQHATKPFDSWFAMGDGQLTLMRIIQERYIDSEFAFLSACHTALGDESTPDEVIHLAAGMQFAGFNGVIGTLWRVDDAVAHQVVTRFYREMFNRPVLDFEYAATALNTAVVETTNDVVLEKRIVFVHIGI